MYLRTMVTPVPFSLIISHVTQKGLCVPVLSGWISMIDELSCKPLSTNSVHDVAVKQTNKDKGKFLKERGNENLGLKHINYVSPPARHIRCLHFNLHFDIDLQVQINLYAKLYYTCTDL